MATLLLGNPNPLAPDGSPAEDVGEPYITRVEFPRTVEDEAEAVEALAEHPDHKYRIAGLPDDWRPYYVHLLEVESLWAHHGADNPEWVSCDDPALAALIADRYGAEVRDAE